ncbi:MAG: DUF1800 domain-containing protein [Pirellulales bacterium]
MIQTLTQIDPQEAWQPAPDKKWDLKWAAHLYRRAAFGVPPRRGEAEREATSWELIQRAIEQGRDAMIEELLVGGPGQDAFDKLLDGLGQRFASSDEQLDKLQGWWLYRMVHTPHPLREQMTLFWHNHFATSVSKVRRLSSMLGQNQLLRGHALGRFRPLLLAMVGDPAMLVWLDGVNSVKGQPNENFARELFELFSLGVGNYTETDIQEAARALTGWRLDGDRAVFAADRHDDGQKTVFGQRGNWRDSDIVRIVLEQPAMGRFLARALFRQFISEVESPPDGLLEPLAEELRKSDYDIAGCVRTILRSQIFYSEQAWRTRVKGPVDYVVGLLRRLDASVPVEVLATSMDGIGQSLFAPPNVKGWEGGRAWLNSATLVSRHNLAWRLVGGQDPEFSSRVDLTRIVNKHGADEPAALVEFLLNLLLDGDVSEESRKLLVDFANKDPGNKDEPKRLAELVHTILVMPEYQLA